jgi:hypothetical protein
MQEDLEELLSLFRSMSEEEKQAILENARKVLEDQPDPT